MSRSSRRPATLIIDTREQEPYSFDPRLATAVRRALPAGDYSVDGLEACVAVERKTLDDFVSTVIHSRERFRAELQKLAGYRAACVVVEAGHYRRSAAALPGRGAPQRGAGERAVDHPRLPHPGFLLRESPGRLPVCAGLLARRAREVEYMTAERSQHPWRRGDGLLLGTGILAPAAFAPPTAPS